MTYELKKCSLEMRLKNLRQNNNAYLHIATTSLLGNSCSNQMTENLYSNYIYILFHTTENNRKQNVGFTKKLSNKL